MKKSSFKEIREAAKTTIADRKVSPKLANSIIRVASAALQKLKLTFLSVFFWILAKLKKILPLP